MGCFQWIHYFLSDSSPQELILHCYFYSLIPLFNFYSRYWDPLHQHFLIVLVIPRNHRLIIHFNGHLIS